MEAKDRVEDMVGPKAVGREAMLEKKQLRRENDRTFRERGDDGLDMDESTTMGGGDSFKERYDTPSFSAYWASLPFSIAKRDAARRRYDQKNEGKNTAIRERSNAIREKEKVSTPVSSSIFSPTLLQATMDMFQQLAKQRFGWLDK
jgi:hypothetical protein